jgi:hypothetical protein
LIERIRNKLRRKEPANEASSPVEIWSHLVHTHRFFKRLTLVSTVLAGIGLATGAYGMLYALHKPLVFAVGSEGDARFLGRRGNLAAPNEDEVRYVSKRFLVKTLAFHSETIEADLADAMNLMTDGLRREMETAFATYEQEKGEAFVAWVKKQAIRMSLDVKSMTIQNHEHAFTVRIRARIATWPLRELALEAAERERDVEAQLSLVVVPRTERTPHGLLVSASAHRFFKVATTKGALEQKVQGSSDLKTP